MAAKRATSYAERLKLGIAVIHGEAKEDEEEDDGRASPPPSFSNRVTSVGTVLPPLMCKEKPPISVVGDVGGRIAIMVRKFEKNPKNPENFPSNRRIELDSCNL